MDKIIDTYNALVGGCIALLGTVLGKHWPLFAIFLLFNVLLFLFSVSGHHASTSNLYPIPHTVLIYSPLSPILLLSFLTWVSMVRASPK